jgi:beta-glucanase (GH16 family)
VSVLRTAGVLVSTAVLAFAQDGWQLVWSDEFSGPANSSPDPAKWTYDRGASGWGNRELENYTNARENASLDGQGNLVIRALKSADGAYTSARLKTQGKFTFTYGKVEARIRIPFGQGIWPAFWMLGANIDSAHWPACGEVDIMENIGKEPARVHGTVHGPGYSGGNGIGKPYDLVGPGRFADDFHLFTVVWQPGSLEFLVDGAAYHRVTSASLPKGARWVFDAPMFLLLNLAIGGNWPGNPDVTTQFPREMVVDYVRVYRAGPAAR